ncbi:hypothetical protein IW262DRAFT_1455195 [Armillaria fumosa]|nr:hypothetical protein IW262DRAFT_1455195 [Armillaria fumosa]
MFFLFFQLCTVIALIPLVLSLNITLEPSAPQAFQSARISLRWAPNAPVEFVLGAFTNDASVMVATTIKVMENFTADRTVDMTFNYTSPSGKDCILLAWLPEAQPSNKFAQSEPFSVIGGRPGIPGTPGPEASSSTVIEAFSTTSNPTTSDFTPSISGTAPSFTSSPAPGNTQLTTKAIPTEAIVGAVIGAFVLLSIISAALFVLLWRRRNRKLKESAPSRAFWRYLDRKGPPISRPVRETLPAYTAQGRTFQRPAVRPPPLRLPD